jgi:hypothetical protein
MTAKTAILVVVGAGCIAAAGAGGYLALRMNPADGASSDTANAAAPEVLDTTPAAAEPVPAVEADKPASSAAEAGPGPQNRVPQARTEAEPPRARTAGSTGRPAASNATADADAPRTALPVLRTQPPTPPVPDEIPPVPPPALEPPLPPGPPPREYEELTVKEDSVMGVRLDADVSSATARVEDRVSGRIARDVTVDGRTAIPAGARLEGVVTVVERAGKFKNRPRIGVRFDTLVLPDRTRMKIQTDTIFREGESASNEATAKVGASAVVGAILGAVIGGKKGAVIGGTAGAAGGTAAVMASDRNEAVLPAGVPLTVRLTAPVTVLVNKNLD